MVWILVIWSILTFSAWHLAGKRAEYSIKREKYLQKCIDWTADNWSEIADGRKLSAIEWFMDKYPSFPETLTRSVESFYTEEELYEINEKL